MPWFDVVSDYGVVVPCVSLMSYLRVMVAAWRRIQAKNRLRLLWTFSWEKWRPTSSFLSQKVWSSNGLRP